MFKNGFPNKHLSGLHPYFFCVCRMKIIAPLEIITGSPET